MTYSIIQIPKKNGSFRTIYVPCRNLKEDLRNDLHLLNDVATKLADSAFGFIPNKNVVSAAKLHTPYKYTICWDIKDFFDSVTPEMFIKIIEDNQNIINDFSVKMLKKTNKYFIDGAPRQGLPTSPAIANIAAVNLDKEIKSSIDGVYTRYADDLTVSFNDEDKLKHYLKLIPEIVSKHGFAINPSKTRVQFSNRVRIICGVGVDENGVRPTRAVKRKIRALEHLSQKNVSNREILKYRLNGVKEWSKLKEPVGSHIGVKSDNTKFIISDAFGIQKNRNNRTRLRSIMESVNVRTFYKALNMIGNVELAAGLVATFGHEWPNWLKGNDVSDHDATFWLPTNILPEDGFGKALFRWRKEVPGLLKKKLALGIIAKNWANLSKDDRNKSFSETLNLSYSVSFGDSSEFAVHAGRAGVSESEYRYLSNRWNKAKKNLTHLNIPHTSVSVGEYVLKNLNKSDPIVPWIGLYTGCCQHLDSQGKTCAWHSVESPDGALIVIEKNHELIAQSWVWRSGNIVVADNCEAIESDSGVFIELYELWADAIIGKLGVEQVRIGGFNDFAISPKWSKSDSIPTPNGCYSDAKNQRVIKSI